MSRLQIIRWLHINWFIVATIAFAFALGAGEVFIFVRFHPNLLIMAALCCASVAALFGFVLLLLRIRRPISDFWYRWHTRELDLAEKKVERSATR